MKPNWTLAVEWMSKLWFIYIMKNYRSSKREGTTVHINIGGSHGLNEPDNSLNTM